jgi:hypothetical protein
VAPRFSEARYEEGLYFAKASPNANPIISNGGTHVRRGARGELFHMNTTETLSVVEGGESKVGEIWTIDHSTRSTEEFLALLHDHATDSLVDVRSFPGSRRCPQFGRETMSTWLADHAITYQHASDLGGRRNRQPDVDPAINAAWRNASFRNYADYTLGDNYQAAIVQLAIMAQTSRVAFMCSEALPWRCHRSLVADTLVARNWAVHHIMSVGKVIEHRLGAWGPEPLVADGRVTYPEPQD